MLFQSTLVTESVALSRPCDKLIQFLYQPAHVVFRS